MDAFTQLGRIQYSMQYKDQPAVFRKEAHPAFPEAFGKAFAMSAQTPEYLYQENLLPSKDMDNSQNINYLMRQALTFIPQVPFSYMLENWRWALYEDKFSVGNMNCEWALRRQDIQGIRPPSMRTSNDFDAAGKQEVITDQEYMKNFMSTILQFQ